MNRIKTKMDIWQTAYDAIIKQGRKCTKTTIDEYGSEEEKCLYLAQNGDKCAFGHLLPTEWIKKYQDKIEGFVATTIMMMENLECPENWDKNSWENEDIQNFCNTVQWCHDIATSNFVENFKTRMERIRPS